MNPQNDQPNGQVGAPMTARGQARLRLSPPPRSSTSQQAAADVIRGQLDSIYSQAAEGQTTTSYENQTTTQAVSIQDPVTSADNSNVDTSKTNVPQGHGLRTRPEGATDNPENNTQTLNYTPAESIYRRTMSTRMQQAQQQNSQWQQYHSAWQKYYQLYYERYYQNKNYVESQQRAKSSQTTTETAEQNDSISESLSQKEAMQELRQSIRKKVVESADKVKKSRHFVPALAGVMVLFIFMFLQYNRVIFGTVAAYVSPGNIEPQNIIVDPTVSVDVGPEPKMIIPKINLDAPVVYGVGPDEKSQMAAMEKGIAHFSIPGASAVPGQLGNTVMAAHSSNDVFASGDYKFVFARNERLSKGDVIYMNYQGKRYTYSITSTEVVMPNEVSKVQVGTEKPMLTLVSCVPLGTAEKRLLVFAEQISPSPAKAAAPDKTPTAPSSKNIPGKPSPSLIERLFGG